MTFDYSASTAWASTSIGEYSKRSAELMYKWLEGRHCADRYEARKRMIRYDMLPYGKV